MTWPGVDPRAFASPTTGVVKTKNIIRPTDYVIWRGEVIDLNRFADRRPALEGRVRAARKVGFIGQVSK